MTGEKANKAIDRVIKVEGGYVNHPNDPGGSTNWGITQRTLDEYMDRLGADSFPVQFLAKYQARDIYRQRYWKPMRLSEIRHDTIAYALFDQGVNQGPRTAIRRAQFVINYAFRPDTRLVEDGLIGPKTIAAINDLGGETNFVIEYVKQSQLYYVKLARRNPGLIAFLKGWIKRTHHLLNLAMYGV